MVAKNTNENANQYSYGYIDSKVNGGEYQSASDVIINIKPFVPAYLYRPHYVNKSSSWFVDKFTNFVGAKGQKFNSKVLFSVKSNSDERVIKDAFSSGVKSFDVASLPEVKKIDALIGKEARLYFMHPIKAFEVIEESYFKHEVKDFSFDTKEELEKIMKATKNAKDINLHVRIAMKCKKSAVDLSDKFGVELEDSLDLVREASKVADKVGVCFHVGSQCMDPREYSLAIAKVSNFYSENKIEVDSFDVGGGFPSSYPNMNTKPMSEYIQEIREALSKADLPEGCDILCEPGRAITSLSESLLVRIEAKKDNMLYINDGTYGGLFDAGSLGFSFFCKVYDDEGEEVQGDKVQDFGFYGPTCDSIDYMSGPFSLPDCVKAGNYIEIFNLGSYSKSLRTNFNGYGEVMHLSVRDEIDEKFCQEL